MNARIPVIALLSLILSAHGAVLAQCTGFPATTADGNCGTGTQLANNANINSGNYYFCGTSNTPVAFSSINLNGGLLRICGNASITGTFNSGIIVVSCGSTVSFPSGIFLNSNVGIVNYGTVNVTGDITFQNNANYVYNESANGIITVSGNITYPSNSGQPAYIKNSGYIKVNGTFYAYEGGHTCFNNGGTMEVNNLLYNSNCGGPANSFTFGSPGGTAIIRYITHAALKAVFTASPNWNVYQATGSTLTNTCGGWGSATASASATALVAPTRPQGCPTLNCFTLPTTILSFTGAQQGNKIALSWTLAQANYNGIYTLEHSPNGLNWSQLSSIAGQINTAYTQFDPAPYAGDNYYRLRQTDADGNSTYSQIVLVANTNKENELSAWPNPVHAGQPVYITYYSPTAETAQLLLTDVLGRTAFSKSVLLAAGNNELTITPAEGMYIAVIHSPSRNQMFSKTIMVVK